MKFVVLGSGTSVPHPKRSSSAYWLETAGGSVLLDCSASAIHRMAQENLDWANLDAIWISHFHLDHCGGLAPFLFGTKHAPNTQDRTKTLRIFGAKGLKRLLKGFDTANDYGLFVQPFPLEIIEIIEIEPFEKFEILPDVEAVSISTPHTDESRAIHLRDTDGKTLVYTADTGPADALAALARRVDLLVMECSCVKNKPVEKHLELVEAMYLIRKAEPKKAVLTHLYPEWDEIDFNVEVGKFTPGCEVIEAVDGLRIET
ncbi:MAG: MBL fold metallo-hydrolase [Pyrinomonadaceae bacterium]